jgi:hypothetical protein
MVTVCSIFFGESEMGGRKEDVRYDLDGGGDGENAGDGINDI